MDDRAVRLDYRSTRNMYFEFEAAYERTARDSQIQTQQLDVIGYYFRLGYRTVF